MNIGKILGFKRDKPDYTNPADVAMPYLNDLPGMVKPIYDPYMDAGKQSLNTIMGQYGNLVNDPNKVMTMLGQGYKESPGYQFQMREAMNAANNAAAAGGGIGGTQHQNQSATIASNLANKDFMDYLSGMMGLYGQGLEGYGGINQLGYTASNEYGNTLGNNQMNKANMAYLGQSNKNQFNANQANANSNLFSQLLGAGTSLVGSYLGGPLGGAVTSLGSSFSGRPR
jgi:hypothetical protein